MYKLNTILYILYHFVLWFLYSHTRIPLLLKTINETLVIKTLRKLIILKPHILFFHILFSIQQIIKLCY